MFKIMVDSFVLMKIDTTLADVCGVRKYLRIFWELKCLQGCSKTFWTDIKIHQYNAVVTASYQSRRFQFHFGGWLISGSRFTKFVLVSSGGVRFVILVSSVTVRKEYLFALQF